MTDILGFGYAAVVAIGGVIGYVKAGTVNDVRKGANVCTLVDNVWTVNRVVQAVALQLAVFIIMMHHYDDTSCRSRC